MHNLRLYIPGVSICWWSPSNNQCNACVTKTSPSISHPSILSSAHMTLFIIALLMTRTPFYRITPLSRQTFGSVSLTSPLARDKFCWPHSICSISCACSFAFYNIRKLHPNLSDPDSSCKHSKCVTLTNTANRTNNMHNYTSPGDAECINMSHFWSTK